MRNLLKNHIALYPISIIIILTALFFMHLDFLSATLAFLISIIHLSVLIGLAFVSNAYFFFLYKKDYKIILAILIALSLTYDIFFGQNPQHNFLYSYYASVPLGISFLSIEVWKYFISKKT